MALDAVKFGSCGFTLWPVFENVQGIGFWVAPQVLFERLPREQGPERSEGRQSHRVSEFAISLGSGPRWDKRAILLNKRTFRFT